MTVGWYEGLNDYTDELAMAGRMPRTMEGIDVEWTIPRVDWKVDIPTVASWVRSSKSTAWPSPPPRPRSARPTPTV